MLAVPGFAESVVAVPVGVTKPVPVLVAVIGIGDTPEEQCAVWRELVGKRGFVLCPRGLPHWVKPGQQDEKDDETGDEPEPDPDVKPVQVGFYQPDAPRLEKEIAAAVTALDAKWPQYVDQNNIVYAGFSRGAFLGPQIAAKAPARFKRLILIEGGHSPWTEDAANAFAKLAVLPAEQFALSPRESRHSVTPHIRKTAVGSSGRALHWVTERQCLLHQCGGAERRLQPTLGQRFR